MSPVEVAFLAPALVAEIVLLWRIVNWLSPWLERQLKAIAEASEERTVVTRSRGGWTKPTAPPTQPPPAGMPPRSVGRNKTRGN